MGSYEGEWRLGKPHGAGTYTGKSGEKGKAGEITCGRWKDGRAPQTPVANRCLGKKLARCFAPWWDTQDDRDDTACPSPEKEDSKVLEEDQNDGPSGKKDGDSGDAVEDETVLGETEVADEPCAATTGEGTVVAASSVLAKRHLAANEHDAETQPLAAKTHSRTVHESDVDVVVQPPENSRGIKSRDVEPSMPSRSS